MAGRMLMHGRTTLAMVLLLGAATLTGVAWSQWKPVAGAANAAIGRSDAGFLATVTKVHDGDTVWVTADGEATSQGHLKLRLEGIDAPEICQSWGRQSRDALADRIMGQQVRVHTDHNDKYGRALADIEIDGEDVGAWMVVNGYAWTYRYKSDEGRYADEEREARLAGRGLFAEKSAVEPRQFRREHGPCTQH